MVATGEELLAVVSAESVTGAPCAGWMAVDWPCVDVEMKRGM